MSDPFASHSAGLDSPASHAAAVTPDDDTDLATTARSLWVGGAGDVAVICADDTVAVTFSGCQAGQVLPFRVRRVLSTGTTATGIRALW